MPWRELFGRFQVVPGTVRCVMLWQLPHLAHAIHVMPGLDGLTRPPHMMGCACRHYFLLACDPTVGNPAPHS